MIEEEKRKKIYGTFEYFLSARGGLKKNPLDRVAAKKSFEKKKSAW